MRISIAILVASTVAASSVHAQPLPNPTFDTDTAGWTLPTEANTNSAWDAFGNPDGSLRITSSYDPSPDLFYFVEATGACITPQIPGVYSIEGDVYQASPGAECRLEMAFYAEPGCTGERGSGLSPNQPVGVWHHQIHATSFPSFRVAMIQAREPAHGENTCYFDNLTLTGPNPSPLEIPTANDVGIATLTLLLAAAALLRFRGSRRAAALG